MNELTLQQKAVRQASYTKTFLWMFIGVIVTAIIAYISAYSGLYYRIYRLVGYTGYFIFSFALMIAQIGVAVNFSRKIAETDESKLKMQFMVYSAILGVTLGSIFMIYSITSLIVALGFTVILFGSLVFAGRVLKLDLTKYSSYLFGALIALIIISVVAMFINFPQEDLLIGGLGVLVFMGITIYDVQKMNKVCNDLQETDSEESDVLMGRYAIYFAFSLYLDFINLFMYILRILNRRR